MTIDRYWDLADEILASLPEISRHDDPQIAPQEYECGCVTIVRVTDRDARQHEQPFEMRLAIACGKHSCQLKGVLKKGTHVQDVSDDIAQIRFEDPTPEYGRLMAWEDFLLHVRDGDFIDYDGCADLALADGRTSRVTIVPSEALTIRRPAWATHVRWYNR